MANNIKVTIVEDDFFIGNFIVSSLTSIGYEVADLCNSFDSFVESYQRCVPDLVLLDIKIEGEKTGIDVAAYLRSKSDIPFVFISTLNDKKTIDDAKKTRPSAYLIKPFDEDDLYAAIEIALFNHAAQLQPVENPAEDSIILPGFIFIKQKQSFIKIALRDIIYLESIGNYIKLFTKMETFTIRQSINTLEASFPTYFFRVHRSYLVNLHFAQKIAESSIEMTNKTAIPISRNIYNKLLDSIRVINK
jgi:DNA-binding LytR/AlgR family response regulator